MLWLSSNFELWWWNSTRKFLKNLTNFAKFFNLCIDFAQNCNCIHKLRIIDYDAVWAYLNSTHHCLAIWDGCRCLRALVTTIIALQ